MPRSTASRRHRRHHRIHRAAECAVTGSRRALDVLWVALAVGGILLLALLGLLGATPLDPVGLLLALGAGACWALYILLSARVGRAFSGGLASRWLWRLAPWPAACRHRRGG